jgi:hypothetical protein
VREERPRRGSHAPDRDRQCSDRHLRSELDDAVARQAERTDWEAKARGIIRAEMARQQVTYSQLAERLESLGVHEDERNLRNKVSRTPRKTCSG